MKRRIWSLAALLVMGAVIWSGCSSSSPKRTESAAVAPSAGPVAQNSAAGGAYTSGKAAADSAAPPAAPAPGQTANQPASAPIPESGDRKIILNAQFDVKVKDADATIQKLGATVRGSGGYVQETRQSGTKQQGRTVTITLRVPSGQYGAITDLIRESGEVAGQREWTEDVTDQFVDLDARVKSQEIHLAQLQKLYQQGGTIKEMMDLEGEIARVQADIESMKGRLRVLDNRVSFSTIIVTLYEPGAPAPIQPPKTVGERIKRGFVGSWNGVVNFVGDLVVFVISALPVLAFLALILGVPAFFVIRAALRRRSQRSGPVPPVPSREQNPSDTDGPPPFPR